MKIITIAKAGPAEMCVRFSTSSYQADILKSAEELNVLPEGIAYAEVYVKVADLIRDSGNGRLVLDDIKEIEILS